MTPASPRGSSRHKGCYSDPLKEQVCFTSELCLVGEKKSGTQIKTGRKRGVEGERENKIETVAVIRLN